MEERLVRTTRGDAMVKYSGTRVDKVFLERARW